jgi:hypothetical protein
VLAVICLYNRNGSFCQSISLLGHACAHRLQPCFHTAYRFDKISDEEEPCVIWGDEGKR